MGIIPGFDEISEWTRWGIDRMNVLREHLIKNSPCLEDEVVVDVVGQPGASKQQLYFLALTTANGIVRRKAALANLANIANIFAGPRFGVLQIVYDAASNWVRCVLAYRLGTLGLAVDNILAGIGVFGDEDRLNFDFDQLPVYNGPQCDVVGGEMNFVSDVLPGVPSSSTTPGMPILPFQGRTILTTCPTVPDPVPVVANNRVVNSEPVTGPTTPIPTPNPKPPGDNRSRGRVMSTPGTIPVPLVGPPVGGSPDYSPSMTYRTGQPQLDRCCTWSSQLVPLVMAALTEPGSFGQELFPPPVQGPLGS